MARGANRSRKKSAAGFSGGRRRATQDFSGRPPQPGQIRQRWRRAERSAHFPRRHGGHRASPASLELAARPLRRLLPFLERFRFDRQKLESLHQNAERFRSAVPHPSQNPRRPHWGMHLPLAATHLPLRARWLAPHYAHFAFSPGASKPLAISRARTPSYPALCSLSCRQQPPRPTSPLTPCMHNSDREQLLQQDSADRGNELYRQRRLKRSHHLMNSQEQDAFASLSSPRGEQQQLLCKYKSGKCSNPRATKRNGQLHTLCHFHRDRQNEHQRKSDRKHRMVSVARRAKLGSIGVGSDSARRHSLHSITSLEAAFPNGSSVSPLSRFAYDQNASDAFRNTQYPAAAVPNGLAGLVPSPPPAAAAAGTTRLPPISFLMPGKLDGYRATSTTVPNLPPNSFITDSLNGNAGKTA